MINFSFTLLNPWSKRWSNVWSRTYKTPFENKFIELELHKDTTIVSFMLHLSTRQSHGGLSIELGLLGYSFNFNFYDNRHWSYELDRYFNYGEE
jgi:hypothetical protein